ncbi:hypothetical protein GCM10023144_21670 [Pigmentiphaga soli]|uniref:Uncharacterized protein n=1 Tax=Pigmentiphaga soli TaxID=1007095 RepID=A0ABP8GZ99_9BURK
MSELNRELQERIKEGNAIEATSDQRQSHSTNETATLEILPNDYGPQIRPRQRGGGRTSPAPVCARPSAPPGGRAATRFYVIVRTRNLAFAACGKTASGAYKVNTYT